MTGDQLFVVALVSAILTSIASLLGTLMIQLFAWNTSLAIRKRELEDRKEVARQAKMATDAAKASAIASTEALGIVHTAVVEVGKKATAAYQEANNANLKIQAVQDAISAVLDVPTVPITKTTGAVSIEDSQPSKKT